MDCSLNAKFSDSSLHNDYQLVCKLGKGTFGSVYKAFRWGNR